MKQSATTLTLVLTFAIALVTALIATSAGATAQDTPEPTATAVVEGDTEALDDAPISNVGVLLFGSVLLAGGIWAYQNRAKRGYRY